MFYYLLERKKRICKDEYALLMLLTTCLDAGEKVDENLQWGVMVERERERKRDEEMEWKCRKKKNKDRQKQR